MEDTYQDVHFLQESVTLQGVTISVYVYEIDGMLIDAGAKSIATSVKAFVERHSPEQALITHLHEDHFGMADWLQREKGIPLYIHPMSVEAAASPPPLPHYRQLLWGNPDPFYPKPLGSTHETKHHHFQIVETPGHAPDHVVLYDAEQGRLFSGDLFLGSKMKICIRGESMPALMNSLRRVLALDFDTLFCAHAGVVPNGKERLRQKLNHLEELEHIISERYQQGWGLREITRSLFPKRPVIYRLSYGEWSPIHIVQSFFRECTRQHQL